jgi:hypothetical protein
MASDNLTKTMKVISTITLGHMASVTLFKLTTLQPSLEEQKDLAGVKVRFSLLFLSHS